MKTIVLYQFKSLLDLLAFKQKIGQNWYKIDFDKKMIAYDTDSNLSEIAEECKGTLVIDSERDSAHTVFLKS